MMDCLEMPDTFTGIGIQTHESFAEQTVAFACPAVIVVAGRPEWDIQKTPAFINGHRRPRIGMAGVGFSAVLPRVIPELALLRNRIEFPNTLTGADVECLNVARRIFFVNQP